jgi:hypothetical protein
MRWQVFKALLLVVAAFGMIAIAIAHKPFKRSFLQRIDPTEQWDANGNVSKPRS